MEVVVVVAAADEEEENLDLRSNDAVESKENMGQQGGFRDWRRKRRRRKAAFGVRWVLGSSARAGAAVLGAGEQREGWCCCLGFIHFWCVW